MLDKQCVKCRINTGYIFLPHDCAVRKFGGGGGVGGRHLCHLVRLAD